MKTLGQFCSFINKEDILYAYMDNVRLTKEKVSSILFPMMPIPFKEQLYIQFKNHAIDVSLWADGSTCWRTINMMAVLEDKRILRNKKSMS